MSLGGLSRKNPRSVVLVFPGSGPGFVGRIFPAGNTTTALLPSPYRMLGDSVG